MNECTVDNFPCMSKKQTSETRTRKPERRNVTHHNVRLSPRHFFDADQLGWCVNVANLVEEHRATRGEQTVGIVERTTTARKQQNPKNELGDSQQHVGHDGVDVKNGVDLETSQDVSASEKEKKERREKDREIKIFSLLYIKKLRH